MMFQTYNSFLIFETQMNKFLMKLRDFCPFIESPCNQTFDSSKSSRRHSTSNPYELESLRARFTKQGKLTVERNSIKAPIGEEKSAGDLLTMRILKKHGSFP